MPFDGSSTADDGSSSNQIASEQEASKNAKPALIPDKGNGKSRQEDDLDLEKGIKVDDDAELAESEMGQSSGRRELKDDDEDDDGRCRVCHSVFNGVLATSETMQLGCHCKEDLSIAHRDCAEAWFKIKGNRICEICGATAQNIVGIEDTGDFLEQWNDADASNMAEPQARCWQSLSLCNFFLACMVVTFILLWLFRVTI